MVAADEPESRHVEAQIGSQRFEHGRQRLVGGGGFTHHLADGELHRQSAFALVLRRDIAEDAAHRDRLAAVLAAAQACFQLAIHPVCVLHP